MAYLKEFRSQHLIEPVLQQIKTELSSQPSTIVKIMHICGTHEATITRWAIRNLLPSNIQLVSGPGCPVCVTPASDIDLVIEYMKNGYNILSYGDMVDVVGTKSSLEQIKPHQDAVKIVLGAMDAVKIARNNPKSKYIFFSPGFETTTPMIALEIQKGLPENLLVYSSHKLVPPALHILTTLPGLSLDGFILPGHVTVIIGMQAYRSLHIPYPSVVVGFEPLDVVVGVLEILKAIKTQSNEPLNLYKRVVNDSGNIKAQETINDVFEPCTSNWRGLGTWKDSGLAIRSKYSHIDAKKILDKITVPYESIDIPHGCSCHEVLIGKKFPKECPLFLKKCTLESPIGPCMVGHEGTCAIQAKYQQ